MAKKPQVEEQAANEAVQPVIEVDESELNAGLRVSVRDILKKKEERRAKIEQERAARAASPTGGRLNRLRVMADTIYGVKFLHEYDKGIELYVHLWKGDEPCHEICKVHYGEPCDICQMVGTKFGECYAIAVRCFLGYVYNLVGQTFSKTDERTGETKVFKLNPVKLIEIPLGKEDINVGTLQEAARRRYFNEDIWQIERKKGKGFLQPKTIDADKFRAAVGRDVPLDVPAEAQSLGELTKVETMKLILSAFENVEWEKLGMKPPTAAPAAEETPAAPAAVASSSKSNEVADDLMS